MSPIHLDMESLFPVPIEGLWRLLHAHLDDDRLRAIHPSILSGRTTGETGAIEFNGLTFPREKRAERIAKFGPRPARTMWRYTIEPPRRYSYETDFENGSIVRLDNSYRPTEGGTLVRTTGDVSIKGVPSFLARRVVNRSLDRGDDEDLAYARTMGL
ncbi:MAG: hypothetical protein L3J78_00335 [Thermoplasmata archaeon]|nr:hypothetical protein [Thermoplasmata archaeon]